MQGYGGTRAAEQYLAQRVAGASTEQLAAMLLEGAQRFLGLSIIAIQQRDHAAKARHLCRTADIVGELTTWLNLEEGAEVAVNLARIFDWWRRELFDASAANDTARLERLARQMGEIRSAWEELHRRHAAALSQPAEASRSPVLNGFAT